MTTTTKNTKPLQSKPRSSGFSKGKNSTKATTSKTAQLFAPTKTKSTKSQPNKAELQPNASRKPKKIARKSSYTERCIFSILLITLSLLLFRSIFSYFDTWKQDYSICSFDHLFSSNIVAENSIGKIGALIGNFMVGGLFGIFALLIPLIVIFLALLILRLKPLFFRKALVSSTFLILIGSVASAYFGSDSLGIYGSSLGGDWGLFISSSLQNLMGVDGTAIIIIMFIALWMVYTSITVVKYLGKSIKSIFTTIYKGFELIFTHLAAQPKKRGTLSPNPTPEPTKDEPIYQVTDEDVVVLPSSDDELDNDEVTINPFEQQSTDLTEREATIINPSFNNYSEDEDFVLFDGEDTTLEQEIAPLEPANKATPPEEELKSQPLDPIFEIEKQVESQIPPISLQSDENSNKHTSTEDIEDKFEIAVTDSATIMAASIPDDVIITTNEHLQVDQINNEVYDPTLELSDYKLPSVELLDNHTKKVVVTEQELYENKNKIVETLNNFNIAIDKIKATIGPTVTLYEIKPAIGVRIAKIKNLEDDIALSLSALGIRIIAPIPGKGTIGIEVPNNNKEIVSMYSVIKSAKFQETKFDLPIVLGRTIQNDDFVIDLAKMPHLLVAGATGQGKSVGLNAIITSLLYKKHPAELKLVLVDPKKVELTLYASIEKHFLAKMSGEEEAIITDTDKVIYTLNSLCVEMDARYMLLKNAKVRNIKEYNAKFTSRRLNPNKGHKFLPYFVVIIDEFADLIMTAGREIETPIARIAQLARAVGIHLVIATQRPTTNIITGVIKANFPARIAFRVSSMIDSRTILDQPGANQLIGQGDMLVSTGNETIRVQCAFVDTPEVERITDFIGEQRGYSEAYELPEYAPESKKSDVGSPMMTKLDEKFEEVARYVVQNQQGSASTIQRNFNIGFNRAGRLMDQLEKAGIVGKQDGSKPRQVLVSDMATLEVKLYDIENGNNQ